MSRRYIHFYRSWYEAANCLSKKDRIAFYDAILAYAFDGIEPEVDGVVMALFTAIKKEIHLKGGDDVAPGRKPLSKRLRFMVLERDNFTCRYCGAKAPDVELQVDHVIPVAKGGADDPDNLVTACVDCNSGKRAHIIGEPRKW